jgi:L-fuconolactonase
MADIDRRAFLTGATAMAASFAARHQLTGQIPWPVRSYPVIDAHIHLFDPTRPQGAPYSGPRTPGQPPVPALPDRYRAVVAPHGPVGAIKVEASPWIEDNLWALEVAHRDTIVVGVIGNLQPEKPEFREYFDRFRKHPLFLGFRDGNLWGRDIAQQSDNPTFIEGLRYVADSGLVFETANPRMSLLEAVLKISDSVPDLRIVLDHLPNFFPSDAERTAYDAVLRELAPRKQIYGKLTEILRRVNGEVSTDLSDYRGHLDQLVETFGENRIIFGSDWPNSDGFASIDHVFRLATEYFATQPAAVAEKYFWKNSVAAYHWVPRNSSQPSLENIA